MKRILTEEEYQKLYKLATQFPSQQAQDKIKRLKAELEAEKATVEVVTKVRRKQIDRLYLENRDLNDKYESAFRSSFLLTAAVILETAILVSVLV